jgi:processing peptidase subunit beta
MNVLLESIHYTSYRDSFLGQPTLGIREVLPHIQQEQIKEFFHNNYTTHNTVVSVAGNVNHQEVVELCKGFKFNEAKTEQKNTDKAYFTPSSLFMRDDEMVN